jgi:hypothetical protein
MQAEGVRVAYQPTVQDYLAIFSHQILQSRAFLAARYLAPVLAVLLSAMALSSGGRLDVTAGAALMILCTLSLWVVGPALIRRGIVNRFAAGESPPRVVYQVDGRGVHGSSAWAAWDDVTGVRETAGAYFVSMKPGAGAYLPKWAMSVEDAALLRTLFETHLGGRARLGPR